MPVTRTLNPLHFEDLEPHRFEDLVRQIAYDFRPWYSIEATGRLGADAGADIRAVERSRLSEDRDSDDVTDASEPDMPYEERIWIIQCKRERAGLSPSRVRAVLSECLPASEAPPHGFILAAASDFSTKARAAAREEFQSRGIQEFILWGKAELEDLLVQPKYDHLLFAYFGISLQTRRRSTRSLLGSRLSMKRRLVKVLGDIGRANPTPVLIRDVASEDYPFPKKSEAFAAAHEWRYFAFEDHLHPDHVAFVAEAYWAWAKFDSKEWDYVAMFEQGYPYSPTLYGGRSRQHSNDSAEETIRRFWHTQVPKQERAMFKKVGFIHYDHIMVVDELGDRLNEGPHIVVDCRSATRPFDWIGEAIDSVDDGWSQHHRIFPKESTRIELFPTTFPEMSDDEFSAALELRR